MRIKALELSGFRGFAQSQALDLDADAVIVIGANGQGKTSLFDAVLWALAGGIPRLGDDDRRLVSMYSVSGEMRVSLDMRNANGDHCRLVRSFDGDLQHLGLEVNGEVSREAAAKSRLLELLWPQALVSPEGAAALTAAITRTVYLQQDLVRQFIEADSEQERFNALSELVGAGRVTELQLQLERDKTAWTRATNVRVRDTEAAGERLARLEGQLADLSRLGGEVERETEATWAAWWDQARQLGVSVRRVPPIDSVEAPPILDAAVKQMEALRRANDRRRDLALELLDEVAAQAAVPIPDEEPLRQAVEAAKQDVRVTRDALADAEKRAAEERRAQVEVRAAREEMRALAQLALRHLGERCPVCAQLYDESATRHRLAQLGAATPEEETAPSSTDDVAKLAAVQEERERTLSVAEARLRQAEQAGREWRARIADQERRLRELGVDPDLAPTAIQTLADELAATTAALAAQQQRGERVALALAQAAARARITELEREVAATRKEVEELDASVRSREETGELAGRVLDGLREAASHVVSVELEHIGPVLQRIYARADPHPAFRAVRLLTRVTRGRGRLMTAIDDTLADLSTESPETVLSSSQMNALAVAVFLALNLGVPAPPLRSMMLDDPMQSLDDIHLLGLIDLLRRTKDGRQLILSTHDARFGHLLARKLRPVGNDERTVVIELDGWRREGPLVTQRDVLADSARLRIAV
jgi:hypothetical protein